jgi:hypothetical protein
MANADTTTEACPDLLPASDIHYSMMAGALAGISFDDMSYEDCLTLMYCCDESRNGLCHCLSVLSNVLSNAKTTAEVTSPQEIAHTLSAISHLVPALTDLSRYLLTDLQQRRIVVN